MPDADPTQTWWGQPGAGYRLPGAQGVEPGAVPPPGLAAPVAERKVPLLRRLPGAAVAAAAAGLLVVGAQGGGPGGTVVTVITSSDTQVRAAAGSTTGALAVGDVVMVRGTTSTDGSVTATPVVRGELRGSSGGQPGGTGAAQGGASGSTAVPRNTTGTSTWPDPTSAR